VLATGTDNRRSFWGWGLEERHLEAPALGRVAGTLAERLGIPAKVRRPARLEDVRLRPPRVSVPDALAHVLTDDRFERCLHSHGQSYVEVLRGSFGEFPHPPDVVAFPSDEHEIEQIFDWCSSLRLAVIPFGGGSSVVRGVAPEVGDRHVGVVTVDLGAMRSVRAVDKVSRAALVEAGVLGPDLERQLAAHGLTLRHFPQSFEFSTLGGWIATRSAGHYATRTTRIDDFVESVRAVTPAGTVETRRLPSSGAGPDANALFLGSEGCFGVITQAWLRVQERVQFRARATVGIGDEAAALECVRALAQSGLDPANCRLLDPAETVVAGVGDGSRFVLLLGFESADHPVDAGLKRALELCRDHGGTVLAGQRGRSRFGSFGRSGGGGGGDGGGPGEPGPAGGGWAWDPGEVPGAADAAHDSGSPQADAWRRSFLAAPYMRDALVLCGALCETFETAVTWDRLPDLHARVRRAATDAIAEAAGGAGLLTWRLSHLYPDGAAPYYTVIAEARRGSEESQSATIAAAIGEAVAAGGGTTTHHHAVGRDRLRAYEREQPDLVRTAFSAARHIFDPRGICNPGALVR
jgi:alkyldihydroxyacetonephosphate synthase